jgi:hypothetical protein
MRTITKKSKSREYYQQLCDKLNNINNKWKHFYFIVETFYIEDKDGNVKETHVSLDRVHENDIRRLSSNLYKAVKVCLSENLARCTVRQIIGDHDKSQKMTLGEKIILHH